MPNKKDHNESISFPNAGDLSTYIENPSDLESRDHTTRSRLKAVLLYQEGHRLDYVIAKTGCSRSSLLSWYKAYKLQGIKGLFDRRQGGNNAKLTDQQISELSERLRGHAPRDFLGLRTATPGGQLWTVEDLYNIIWEWYGVRYRSRTSYYSLLKKCLPQDRRSE